MKSFQRLHLLSATSCRNYMRYSCLAQLFAMPLGWRPTSAKLNQLQQKKNIIGEMQDIPIPIGPPDE